MNSTNVSLQDSTAPDDVLHHLSGVLPDLTPEVRKAATYVLENAQEISVSSVREIATAANVKPNTMVRMARTIGFDGYEGFREKFRDHVRQGKDNYPDRARWLQSLSSGGQLSGLYADMAQSAIANIEALYSASSPDDIQQAADAIIAAKSTFVLGVGIANPYAKNFAYLAGMALNNVIAIPQDGSLPVDGLVQAGPGDVLIAMTFKPFRREVVDAVEVAVANGVDVIAISDTPAAPHFADAKYRFIVPTETPQFFSSTIALTAFLETLTAFVIADADTNAVASIKRFHERRHELGIYIEEQT